MDQGEDKKIDPRYVRIADGNEEKLDEHVVKFGAYLTSTVGSEITEERFCQDFLTCIVKLPHKIAVYAHVINIVAQNKGEEVK